MKTAPLVWGGIFIRSDYLSKIENYTSLFDNTDELLNSKQIIEVLKTLQKKQPEIYCGKGEFKRLIIEFEKGISEKELSSVLKKHKGFVLPQEYTDLLKLSNGITFFEYGDALLLNIEEAFELSDEEWLEQGYLKIARANEDDIYMKCDNSERNIYYSAEGFGELTPLNMSFTAFLEASLISGFSYFWLWGTKDYDLY